MPSAVRTLRPAGAGAGRRNDRSETAKAYRHWYSKAIWRGPGGIREQQLAAHPLCNRCEREGRVTPATVVDHVGGHRGDWDRFVGGPFESLCKPHHDRDAQREERGGEAWDEGAWV